MVIPHQFFVVKGGHLPSVHKHVTGGGFIHTSHNVQKGSLAGTPTVPGYIPALLFPR